jgi:hypothetical protein
MVEMSNLPVQMTKSAWHGLFWLLVVILLLGLVSPIRAATTADYSIDWWTVDGGGAESTGGNYVLNGTIGQSDASLALTGGFYTVQGGFWDVALSAQTEWRLYLPLVTR